MKNLIAALSIALLTGASAAALADDPSEQPVEVETDTTEAATEAAVEAAEAALEEAKAACEALTVAAEKEACLAAVALGAESTEEAAPKKGGKAQRSDTNRMEAEFTEE